MKDRKGVDGVPLGAQIHVSDSLDGSQEVTRTNNNGVKNKVQKFLIGPRRVLKHTTSCPPG